MTKINNVEEIMKLSAQWKESRVFLTAVELKLFDYLENDITSKELSAKINASERHLDRLLNTLVVLGLVEKKQSTFKNTKLSSCFLNSGSGDYLLGLNHANHMYHYWSFLTDVIREGKPARDFEHVQLIENWVEDFITAMQQHGGARAKEIIDLIEFKECNKYLDLGGGSGAFSVEVAKKTPHLDVSIFDLPNVIPITERFVNKSGEFPNISYIKGDYLSDNIGFGYDLIFISNIIHSHGPEEIELIFGKCFNSLNKGGKLIVHDFLVDNDRKNPDWAVFFAINMLVHTENGDTYSENEVREIVEKIGFHFEYCIRTKSNSNLIVASKK